MNLPKAKRETKEHRITREALIKIMISDSKKQLRRFGIIINP